MKTIYVTFSNHFDLIWRRGWERNTDYMGGRYPGYRRIEELLLLKNLALAEAGEGAYQVEQALTLRAFLDSHPDALPRLQALYEQGLFEMMGAGEAIIDVNMCHFETMIRNMASGVRYCHDVLGMSPLQANHGDGFGSSAQFPQVIRGCGFRSIPSLSYSQPDNRYWRGLDGSVVYFGGAGAPGRGYFFDHDYHEPCRVCHGFEYEPCVACQGTGLDLPQNVYPPFEPVEVEKIPGEIGAYSICSEEMLPPEGFSATLRAWEAGQPELRYVWGTSRNFAHLWAEAEALADNPPAELLASRVENNPCQTGCLVSRIRIKQRARRCEGVFFGWEAALALSGKALDRATWEPLFLELPLFFFHDAITGTHQDEAYIELLERMARLQSGVKAAALAALGEGASSNAAWTFGELPLWTFPLTDHPVRVPLPVADWHRAEPHVAVAEDGRRFPIVLPLHRFSPEMPLNSWRLVAATGPNARTRPDAITAYIEADGLTPLAWSKLQVEKAVEPTPLEGNVLSNAALEVCFDDHGIVAVTDKATGATAAADDLRLGELLVEEDEGDPWGTRKLSAFRRALGEYTHFLGALQFDGYQEAYFQGRFEPSLRFGREEDPFLFPLDWYITVRLLDGARRVDVQYELYWKSANRRIRAAFPTGAGTDTGLYSIPGGWLQRERYEQTETFLWSPNGDWPAVHWFGSLGAPVSSPANWAVVNYGTPSARIEDGRLLVSLLRSPGFGHCLERYAQDYPMPTSGIRDNGWHHFTLSFMPYTDPAEMSLAASALNACPPSALAHALPALPTLRIDGAGIELLSAKPPFTGDGLVLRLLNLRDTANTATLHLPDGTRAQECNMLEEGTGEVTGELAFRAFEVKTILVV
jgi:hypothetical protein